MTSTPTAGYYGATDTIEFTVTFTGNMTVTGAPQFAFDLRGTTHQVAYASGSGSEALVFSHTVVATDGDDHDGISWAANALSLNGGAIKYTHTDPAEQVDAPPGPRRAGGAAGPQGRGGEAEVRRGGGERDGADGDVQRGSGYHGRPGELRLHGEEGQRGDVADAEQHGALDLRGYGGR